MGAGGAARKNARQSVGNDFTYGRGRSPTSPACWRSCWGFPHGRGRSMGAFRPPSLSGLSGRGRRGPTDMRCRDWRSGFHTNADEAFGKTSSERRKRPASRKRSAGRGSLSGACLPPETAGSGGCRPAGNGGPVKKTGKQKKNACQSPSFFIEKQLCPGGGIGRHTILRW